MPTSAKVGGSWLPVWRMFARVSGAWVEVRNGYAKVGGAWVRHHQGDVVNITNQTISEGGVQSAFAIYRLDPDGLAKSETSGGVTTIESWLAPATYVGKYEARATVQSGSLSLGSGAGTWLALSSLRSWGVVGVLGGSGAATILVEIRRASDAVVVDSATITLSVTSIP